MRVTRLGVSRLEGEVYSFVVMPTAEENLRALLPLEARGRVLGVELSKVRPWPEAALMLKLHEQGKTAAEIAKATGRHIKTVEHNLKTRGEHPQVGPHCDRLANRLLGVEQALLVGAKPCGDNCVCYWRPVFDTDKR